jgi:polysaccharide export outer membrane protein
MNWVLPLFFLLFGSANAEEALENAPAPASAPNYGVHAGDTLIISVWKEQDLNMEVLVQPDGTFSFPLAGDIKAEGKTTDQIRAEIASRIEQYIPEPVVTVSVKQIQGSKIYVVGKVNRPGEFVMNHSIDVMQALSMAGGASTFAALNDIKILRRINGKQISIPFRYGDVEDGENLGQNIVLQSGDVVVVP